MCTLLPALGLSLPKYRCQEMAAGAGPGQQMVSRSVRVLVLAVLDLEVLGTDRAPGLLGRLAGAPHLGCVMLGGLLSGSWLVGAPHPQVLCLALASLTLTGASAPSRVKGVSSGDPRCYSWRKNQAVGLH